MPAETRLIAFDLDDTLTASKSPITGAMAEALAALLTVREVCIISGGRLAQFTEQVLDHLPPVANGRCTLHLMPTCGTQYYRMTPTGLRQVYSHDLPERQRQQAIDALREEAQALGLWEAHPSGDIIEDRGSQVTFSALGQRADLAVKNAWDPTGEKKEALRAAVARRLPGLEVRSGGSTSVDITRNGIDKAYGMTRLAEQTGIALGEMLFIGDRLDEGGNDYPVKAIGVPCMEVTDWRQTLTVVTDVVSQLREAVAAER